MKEMPELLPGDHLLYRPMDWIGWLIAIKTWNIVSHIEIYGGDGRNYAARACKTGVSTYPLRTKGLSLVLRPRKAFDLDSARKWFFAEAIGQAYDYIGFAVFFLAAKHGSRRKMFCSELATRFDRHAGFHAINPHYDADRVAPADFLKTPALDWVWKEQTH